MLARLLRAIAQQDTAAAFSFSVVVTDNDVARSGQDTVEKCARELSIEIVYTVEPQKNIALARNTALAHAQGSLIALIDDDEFPSSTWLLNLFRTLEQSGAAAVLGPVRPHFDEQPPRWLIRGGFYDRPEHPTGYKLNWEECRTGNVLFRRAMLGGLSIPFQPEFGTGGEDQDFFRRAAELGNQFVWCNEAVAHEVVPATRWQQRLMFKRALLRGKNSFQHRAGRWRNVAKSLVAVPAYSLWCPFSLLGGYHRFVMCVVKLCDHFGRLLAVLGLNPIRERPGS